MNLIDCKQEPEQKLVKYIVDDYTGQISEHCPKCGVFIERYSPRNPWKEVRFCCYCGQAVRWRKRSAK